MDDANEGPSLEDRERTVDGIAVDEWCEQLLANRREKDEFFAEHPQSPGPPERREEFEELEYFPPNPEYRVEATVKTFPDPEPVVMEATAGPPLRYRRLALFEFELRGTPQTLSAFRREDESGTLFVPFTDETTGDESYEHGRYMEFQSDQALRDGDAVTLDFNMAYSPFCTFSETFACPIPPGENHLNVRVEAGEKIWA
jgi:hypothetical protein